MMIDFDKIEEAVTDGFKGGQGIMRSKGYFDGSNRIMRASLEPGASIGTHTHEDNCEIVYILKGKGKFIYDGQEFPISEGQCHYCPKGHSHSLINDSEEELFFFAAVPAQP
ncbi:MAG: cupin domain-containing protein [Oscillospiraceae bacterium]